MHDLELRRLQTTEDIDQPYHGVWEQIPKRTARTTVAVRIGDCLPWTCSCLAGICVRTCPLENVSFLGRKTKLLSEPEGELRDDDKFAEFESGGDNLFAERGDVVLVRVADFLTRPWVRSV